MGIWVMRYRGKAASMLVLPNAIGETLSLAVGSALSSIGAYGLGARCLATNDRTKKATAK